MSRRDFYDILGVPRDADTAAIKSAYRKLAMKYHPDRSDAPDAEARFKECSEAYEVLSDADKRARYDRYGHAGIDGMANASAGGFESIFQAFGDIFGGGGGGGGSVFDAFFGGGGGGGGRGRGGRRGASIHAPLNMTLDQTATEQRRNVRVVRPEPCGKCDGSGARAGTKPTTCRTCGGRGIVLQRSGFFSLQTTCPHCRGEGTAITDPCPTCSGAGRQQREREIEVDIPAGVEDGMTLRVRDGGEPGVGGAPAGDLMVEIHVEPHPVFRRYDDACISVQPLTISQAALGASVEVPTLKGTTTTVKVPAGTQSGEAIRLRGMGFPDVRTGRRGDQVVQAVVVVPKKLSKEQEKLFKELSKIEEVPEPPSGTGSTGEKRSWFDSLKGFFTGE
jgi:molecular chaperone DnaJ